MGTAGGTCGREEDANRIPVWAAEATPVWAAEATPVWAAVAIPVWPAEATPVWPAAGNAGSFDLALPQLLLGGAVEAFN
jgi:hypothetical protein